MQVAFENDPFFFSRANLLVQVTLQTFFFDEYYYHSCFWK